MLLLGTTDGFANIHAPNERVLVDEFEKAVLAEAEFFGRYAAMARGPLGIPLGPRSLGASPLIGRGARRGLTGVSPNSGTAARKSTSTHRRIVVRVLALCVTAVSLYLLLPSLLQVFSSWRQLQRLSPYWIVPAVLCEAASFVSLWATPADRATRRKSWFRGRARPSCRRTRPAASSPGGGAAAAAVQYGILLQAGIPAARIAARRSQRAWPRLNRGPCS